MTLKDDKIAKASEIINEKYSETFRKLSECNPIRVGFKRLNDDAIIPTKAHPTDSGFDLCASKDVIIEPGETTVVPTGIAVELPPGYEATVRPRSGITAKTKLRVQLGTIDNEYRGEIGVIVDNIARYGLGVDYYSFYDCDTEWGAYISIHAPI